MFKKPIFTILRFSACLTACFLPISRGGSALAQQPPEKDTTCIACHQEQYTLYDQGKWYCLYESPVHCTDCHGGQLDTMIKEDAHEGLLTDPLVGNAALCQDCHPNDYQEHVAKFAQIAGVHENHQPYITCTPPALISQSVDSGTSTRVFRTLPPGIWQLAGIVLLGTAALGVFLFFLRCWKLDHLG